MTHLQCDQLMGELIELHACSLLPVAGWCLISSQAVHAKIDTVAQLIFNLLVFTGILYTVAMLVTE